MVASSLATRVACRWKSSFGKYLILLLALLLASNNVILISSSVQARSSTVTDTDLSQKTVGVLEQMAGLNMSSYTNVSISGGGGLEHPKSFYELGFVFVRWENSSDFKAELMFADQARTLWAYSLYIDSNQSGEMRPLGDYLTIAIKALNAYGNLFDAAYSHDVVDMISAAVQGQNRTVENDKALLKIFYNEGQQYTGITQIDWYRKAGNTTTTYQSIDLTIKKDGLVSAFSDYLEVYHVATTTINISEEQSINLSTPYAEDYAKTNGFQIGSTQASLDWYRDYYSTRGDDSFALYPVWVFTAGFTQPKNDTYGYQVVLFADSGEILYNQAIHHYTPLANTDASNYLWILLVVVPTVVAVACVGTYVRRKKRKERIAELQRYSGSVTLDGKAEH